MTAVIAQMMNLSADVQIFFFLQYLLMYGKVFQLKNQGDLHIF